MKSTNALTLSLDPAIVRQASHNTILSLRRRRNEIVMCKPLCDFVGHDSNNRWELQPVVTFSCSKMLARLQLL